MNECKYEQCDREATAKGHCTGHYKQQWRGKELAPLEEKRRKPNQTYCLKCDTQKSREDFYLRTKGTLQSACIECMKKAVEARREKTRQALRRLEALESA